MWSFLHLSPKKDLSFFFFAVWAWSGGTIMQDQRGPWRYLCLCSTALAHPSQSAEQEELSISEVLSSSALPTSFCYVNGLPWFVSLGGLYCDLWGRPLIPSKWYQTANKAFGIFSGAASRCCQVFFISMSSVVGGSVRYLFSHLCSTVCDDINPAMVEFVHVSAASLLTCVPTACQRTIIRDVTLDVCVAYLLALLALRRWAEDNSKERF